MYIDKTDRLAGTTKIHEYLDIAEEGKYKVDDEVKVIVYDTAENGTLKIAVDREYIGLILPNEHLEYIYPGEEISARIKRVYEDGILEANEKNIGYFEFKSSAIDDFLYNFMFFLEFEEKTIMGTFSCRYGEYKEWRDVIFEVLKRVRVIREE